VGRREADLAPRPCYTARVLSRVLAFRPASVVGRLPPRSDACPLSLAELLEAAPGYQLPSVEASTPDVVRAALVAAKVLHSAIGLALPAGVAPEPWFERVTRTADEIAAALPLFLSAEVALEGEGAPALDRAAQEVWRLVEAGLTHLAFDSSRVAPPDRARVLREVAGPAQERGLCLDVVLPLVGEGGGLRRAVSLVEELARRGLSADAASVRLPAPEDAEGARAQVAALERLQEALGGLPLLRRGPVTPALLAGLRLSGLRGCEDGGAAARASGAPLPATGGEALAERRSRWRARAAAILGAEEADRLEARAFVEAGEFVEALGAEGSAVAVARSLERRLAGEEA